MVALAGPLSADSRAVVKSTPDRLVDEAGQAKTDGNSALAYAPCAQAVDISPDNALARWQLGQVKVGDEWLSIEEAERRAAADPLQAKYLKRRDAANEKPAAQLQLARWCRSNKLDEEARFHFASFLASNPNNQEAMHALGMRWHNGQLMSLEDIKDSNQDASDVKEGIAAVAVTSFNLDPSVVEQERIAADVGHQRDPRGDRHDGDSVH